MRPTRTILFDVTRLLRRRDAVTPTGIDRVVFEHARWLMHDSRASVVPVWNWRGRLSDMKPQKLMSHLKSIQANWDNDPLGESIQRLQRVVQRINADLPADDALREPRAISRTSSVGSITRFVQSRKPAPLSPNAVYLSSAHSGLESPILLRSLAEKGAASVVFIHDLIPITHPEFCRAGEWERHERRVRATLSFAAQIAVNSQTTADELTLFAERKGLPLPPVTVVPLGVGGAFLESAAAVATRQPYFLAVGTLEARKNLPFLLMVWRLITEALGNRAPKLVLVGSLGWESESIVDLLDRSASLNKTVIEVAGLADRELSALLKGANALLAPSLAEGFNLPVAEALALGVPVIASDIPAHRELLSNSCQLIHPLDGPGWLSAVSKAAQIHQRLPPRIVSTWQSHLSTLDRVITNAQPLSIDGGGRR